MGQAVQCKNGISDFESKSSGYYVSLQSGSNEIFFRRDQSWTELDNVAPPFLPIHFRPGPEFEHENAFTYNSYAMRNVGWDNTVDVIKESYQIPIAVGF